MRRLLLVVLLAGCAQPSLERRRDLHRQIFTLQRIHKNGTTTASRPGLDSQEAATIAQSYRKSLVPAEVKVQEEPGVLLLAPPATDGRGTRMTR